MELRLLEYFLITAREQSMNKAAQVIHISQPSLSRQIAQLEKELGVTLFERSSHGIALSEEGILLEKRARQILDLVNKTQEELQDNESQMEGTIGIGAGEVNAMKEVAQMMHAFHKAHPLVKFEIFTGNADDVSERLQRGLLDMAVLLEPVDLSHYAYIQLQEKEQWGVLMKADDPLSEKDAIETKDLLERELIIPSRPEVQSHLEHWFGKYYQQLHICYSDNLAGNNAYLVQQGLGVCVMVNGLSQLLDPSRFAFRPLKPALCHGCVLAWRRDLPLSLPARKMIEELKAQGKETENTDSAETGRIQK